MFYSIPKKMQDQVIDLFCNTKLKVSTIIKLADPEETIPITEFYQFLENYKKETGKELTRPRKATSPEYKEIINNIKWDNKLNKLRAVKPISVPKSKKSRNNDVEYARVYDSKIMELDEKGLSLTEIRNYFLAFGIEVLDEYKVEPESRIRYFRKIDDTIEINVRKLKKETGASLREISNLLKEKGIMVSHESVRKICGLNLNEEKEDSSVLDKAENVEQNESDKAKIEREEIEEER